MPENEVWIISGNLHLKVAITGEEIVLFPFHNVERVLPIAPFFLSVKVLIMTEEKLLINLYISFEVQIAEEHRELVAKPRKKQR